MSRKIIKIMLIVVIAVISLNSCNVEKRLARKQAKWCSNITKTDTIREIEHDTIYKETVKTVKLAPNPDTLQLYAIAYCDSMQNVQMPAVIVEDKDNGHKASIEIKDNEVKAEIICNMDSLEQIIIEKNTLIRKLQNINITQTKVVTKIKKTGRFYVWFFWILVVLIVFGIALYLTRWYFLSKFNTTKKITDLLP